MLKSADAEIHVIFFITYLAGAPHSIVGSSPMIHTTLQLATWL